MLDSVSRDQLMRALGLVDGEYRSTTGMLDPTSRDHLLKSLGLVERPSVVDGRRDLRHLDPECRAMVIALERLPSWREERHLKGLHNQKDHGRRGPHAGTAGLVGRFTEALAKHVESGGEGKSPLDDFSRPQLLTIAKARGVKLKRNAHRDDIVKSLMGDAGRDVSHSPAAVYGHLEAGRVAEAPPPPLRELMEFFGTRIGTNLANLEVGGEDNKNLYTTHIRDIPRSEMPQLPANVEGLKPFLDRLGEMGVGAELQEMDPRDLVMTQSELDSAKVSKLWRSISENGWSPDVVMIASREGAILDGHHRWAGAATASATGTPVSAKVLRVDMGIDELLELAQEYSGQRAGIGAAA